MVSMERPVLMDPLEPMERLALRVHPVPKAIPALLALLELKDLRERRVHRVHRGLLVRPGLRERRERRVHRAIREHRVRPVILDRRASREPPALRASRVLLERLAVELSRAIGTGTRQRPRAERLPDASESITMRPPRRPPWSCIGSISTTPIGASRSARFAAAITSIFSRPI